MTQKDLAQRVGVSVGYMSEVARGRKNMSPAVQTRVESVLGGPVKIAPASCANRQDGRVKGRRESSYIRERARELGMSLKGLAEHVGVSCGYMTQVSRGERSMSPVVQARVEEALDGPARVEPAQPRSVDPRALWDRMDAHQLSQNETARLAGISSGHLSQIMNGQRNASGEVLRKLHGVLFRSSAAELVVPAEVKVMAWEEGWAETAWWCAAPVGRGLAETSPAAAPCASAGGCPGAPRWSMPTARATTAGARCR